MRRVRLAVLASLSVLATWPALAQAPQVEKNVSMAMALAIIQGAIEQCTKDGYKVSVVIVDKAGNVAASVRGDGTNPHTMEFGRLKAYTSRTRGQTSLEFMKLTSDPANAYLKHVGAQLVIQNIIGVHPAFQYGPSNSGRGLAAYDILKSDQGRTIAVTLTKTW